MGDTLADNLSSSDFLNGEQIQRKLYEAMDTLPAKQKLIFQLKYFEELKYEEISAALGTSVGALKASFHLAVKKIEDYLLTQD
jgi:RNA polymerase sigma-70 factor (ECF subfamily)